LGQAGQAAMAAAEAATLVFEAGEFESCTAIVEEFFRQHRLANIIKVALTTRDLKPLGARIWRVVDGNFEPATRIIVGFIMTQPRGAVTISARVG
jgi:hypothetical protein